MIDRQHDQIVIECDACESVYESGAEGFPAGSEWKEIWPAAKREGWRSTKIAEEWVHTCPKCKP